MPSAGAPAKINWLLHVLGKRDDGYHEVLSLMQKVDLSDKLSFEPLSADDIILESDVPVPKNENLVYRAALLLKKETGCKSGARIKLQKLIPMAAGLGGGSSDAACTLSSLNEVWGLKLTPAGLKELGAKLGSDVPFFLDGSGAIATGRGEIIEYAPLGGPFFILIVKPSFGVSTPWAYSLLKDYTGLTKARENIKIFIRALREGDFSALTGLGRVNDLEPGVLRACPEIERIKTALREKGAVFSSMSGSGSAVFGLFRTSGEAEKAGRELCLSFWCRVVRSVV